MGSIETPQPVKKLKVEGRIDGPADPDSLNNSSLYLEGLDVENYRAKEWTQVQAKEFQSIEELITKQKNVLKDYTPKTRSNHQSLLKQKMLQNIRYRPDSAISDLNVNGKTPKKMDKGKRSNVSLVSKNSSEKALPVLIINNSTRESTVDTLMQVSRIQSKQQSGSMDISCASSEFYAENLSNVYLGKYRLSSYAPSLDLSASLQMPIRQQKPTGRISMLTVAKPKLKKWQQLDR